MRAQRSPKRCPSLLLITANGSTKNSNQPITGRNSAIKARERPGKFRVNEDPLLQGLLLSNEALGIGPSGQRKLGGGLISMELSYKPGSRPHGRQPLEGELIRAAACPHCGLDHAVFGLATCCWDCGRDIFMTHVQAECEVVQKMLADIERRRKELGPRIAARDVENCLEDVVSIYEAVLKVLYVRSRRQRGEKEEDIQDALGKHIRNAFQNVERRRRSLNGSSGCHCYIVSTQAP